MTKIRTTHVGSLIRPAALTPYLEAIEAGQPVDEAAFEPELARAVAGVVKHQADIGLDVVDDGEYGKASWITYFYDRVSGMEKREVPLDENNTLPAGLDREAFAEYYEGHDDVQASEVTKSSEGLAHGEHAAGVESHGTGWQWVCTSPLTYDPAAVKRDIASFKQALAAANVTEGFLPVVAPASAFWLANEYYDSDDDFVFALADTLHQEYQEIVDSGLYLQVDDAVLWHQLGTMRLRGKPEGDFRAWAEVRVEALNRALAGIPADRVRYHVCCGSWHGAHAFDPELREVIDLVLAVNAGYYLFEQATPRHEHEWVMWQDIKLADDKVLVPGVVTHHTPVVEHPELVAQRLVRMAKIVGPERVMGGTDCGFAQNSLTKRVPEWTQWAKLESLVEGARLASQRV